MKLKKNNSSDSSYVTMCDRAPPSKSTYLDHFFQTLEPVRLGKISFDFENILYLAYFHEYQTSAKGSDMIC